VEIIYLSPHIPRHRTRTQKEEMAATESNANLSINANINALDGKSAKPGYHNYQLKSDLLIRKLTV
jgi:hypothetical protein